MNTPATTAIEIKRGGNVCRIRPTVKAGVQYWVLDYYVNGKRKLVWRSSEAEARSAATEALDKIAAGDVLAAEMSNRDAMLLTRAKEVLGDDRKPIDIICMEYQEAAKVLAGRISIVEACKFWVSRNGMVLDEKINVAKAAQLLMGQIIADGKSNDRQVQLRAALTPLAEYFNGKPVADIAPADISAYLASLDRSDRTRANYREIIGYFCRWLVLQKYLPKDTDWLEGVQKYKKTKSGEIEIYTPDELRRMLKVADRMTPFIALAAFAGVRHATIVRMDWSMIDFADKFVKVPASISKNKTRYLIPMHDNLVAWLKPFARPSGPIIHFVAEQEQPATYTAKGLAKVCDATATEDLPAVELKHNGLRHSFISYRVAETADISRTADEAENSPAIIKQHYLQRVKPAQAADWFGISPLC